MPHLVRKRRAQADASPSPPAQRRRSAVASASPSDAEVDGDDGDEEGSHDQMVKKLVRLALAILYPHGRAFKQVFEGAQNCLQDVFGMTLTELPMKEKYTVAQKRAAQRAGNGASQSANSSSKAYILKSTLPKNMRTISILPPPKIPSVAAEAGYTGLYSFVVGIIMLAQGARISEGKLLRYLQKVNADEIALEGEKTEKLLKRMEREGYIVKVREREAGGEESIDWVVGPRGKVEVGERGVAAMVKTVYGKRDVDMEELEDKLERSLGAGTFERKFKRAVDAGDNRIRMPVVGSNAEDRDSAPPGSRRRMNEACEQTKAKSRRSSRRSGGVVEDEAGGTDTGDEEEDREGEGEVEAEEEEEEEEEGKEGEEVEDGDEDD